MELKDEELVHLERLARLKLSGEARDKLKEQLAQIIDFVRQLQRLDTSGYSPRAYVGKYKSFLREDVVGPCLSRDEVLAQSPSSREGFFSVPPVIDIEEA
jgi:aspartyl-tRNA(Asn)/glutamyl-tRNA(Gln) amidotransferase subunit C